MPAEGNGAVVSPAGLGRTVSRPRRHRDPFREKSFEVDLRTVARWDNGQIVEENLWYDLAGLTDQIGLSRWHQPDRA